MLQSWRMVMLVVLGLGLASAPSCMWLYDTDKISGDDEDGVDGPDDGVDSGSPADAADPSALDFQLIPAELFEGEGTAFDPKDVERVRQVPIVLRGQNLSSDMVVTIDGVGFEAVVVEEVAVSPDGYWAAFALRVPVLPDLAQGMNDTIQVRVESSDEVVTRPLTVRGLDSFEQAGGMIDTSDAAIEARYSHVVLDGEIVARGTAPLRLVATAGISVSGALRADAAGQTPGAGGCGGADRGQTPNCGPAAGKVGGTVSGGGGGGFGTAGAHGAPVDGAGGDGGEAAGDSTLVPLPPAASSAARGAGGGGGGTLLNLTGGFPGGGGGGIVELTTPAILRLADGAVISASGAAGMPTGGAGCALGGGSGGGGSGGAILLRGGTSFEAGAVAQVSAVGGPQVGPANCFGGAGGAGRIRIDSADPIDVVDQPAAAVGPMIAGGAPLITRSSAISLSVRGAAATTYDLYVGEANQPAGSIATDKDGLGSANVVLETGANLVCVSESSPAELAHPEAKNCVVVAHVPSDG
jgi:hypothetical protein